MATLISTPQELDAIRNDLTGTYELANDIDLASWGNWTPIGNTTTPFTGSLDGKGFVIRNLTCNLEDSFIGLFGYAYEFRYIRNLGMENCEVNAIGTGNNSAGAICGYPRYNTEDCHNLYVKDSTIKADTRNGALFGQTSNLTLRDSYSLNNIVESRGYVGGLIGRVFWATGYTITNCWSNSIVTDTQYNVVGGLIGGDDTSDTSLYSGLYFDSETSTQSTDPVATPKTTAEMQTQSTYTGYDFTNTWAISGGYPYLQAFGTPTVPPKDETRLVNAHVKAIHSNVTTAIQQAPASETRQVTAFVSPIQAQVRYGVSMSVYPNSYVSPIQAKVVATLSSPETESIDATGYMSPIHSKVDTVIYRPPRIMQINLNSHIRPLEGNVDLFVPFSINTPNAFLYAISNGSHTQYRENSTILSYKLNPSYVEVRK